MKKISLCIPAYNRPDTLRELIASYHKQTYENKELIISDDSSNEDVKNLVSSFGDPSLRYFRNDPGLGFSKNLLASLTRASGDYLIILGDDDILLDQKVLSSYVEVFDKYPTVGFVYSNQIQFSRGATIDAEILFSRKSMRYTKGDEAVSNMLIRSIFIGGIGIRNTKELSSWFPKAKILHPQVAFVGNILCQFDAYLIAKPYIGFRSHDDQIIFRALKNKKIRQEGDHMTVEIYTIFQDLVKKYKLTVSSDILAEQLMGLQKVMLFKEKSVLGNSMMEENYDKFCNLFPKAKASTSFRMYYYLARLLPATVILFLRYVTLQFLAVVNHEKYRSHQRQLLLMTA